MGTDCGDEVSRLTVSEAAASPDTRATGAEVSERGAAGGEGFSCARTTSAGSVMCVVHAAIASRSQVEREIAAEKLCQASDGLPVSHFHTS